MLNNAGGRTDFIPKKQEVRGSHTMKQAERWQTAAPPVGTTELSSREIILLKHHIPLVTEIAKDQNNIQSLTSRMGTGGGNIPLIIVRSDK